MNPKPSLSSTVPGLAAWFCFGILILPTDASSSGSFESDPEEARAASRPYLVALGPSPLRYAAFVAPDPSPLPSAQAGKPHQNSTRGKAVAKKDFVPPAQVPKSDAAEAGRDLRKPAGASETDETTIVGRPKPVLRDEFGGQVRPEDFLPYFAFPSARREGAGYAPMPIVPPPSSATYRQQ